MESKMIVEQSSYKTRCESTQPRARGQREQVPRLTQAAQKKLKDERPRKLETLPVAPQFSPDMTRKKSPVPLNMTGIPMHMVAPV